MQWESQRRDNAPELRPATAGRASRWTRWAAVGVVGCLWGLVFSLNAQVGVSSDSSSGIVSIELAPAQRTLNWAEASQQLVVIGAANDGRRVDLTSEAKFFLSNDSVGRIDASAVFHPLMDGEVEIKAAVRGWEATARFRVRQSDKKRPLRDCHRTSDSIYRYLRQDLVVPFSMEGIAFNVECGDLFIGDLEAGRVEV